MPLEGITTTFFHNMFYSCKVPKYHHLKFTALFLFKQKEFYVTVLSHITITWMSKYKVNINYLNSSITTFFNVKNFGVGHKVFVF